MTVQLYDQKREELAKLSRNALNCSNLPILPTRDLCFFTLGTVKNKSSPKTLTSFTLLNNKHIHCWVQLQCNRNIIPKIPDSELWIVIAMKIHCWMM